MSMFTFQVVSCPTQELACSNRMYVSEAKFRILVDIAKCYGRPPPNKMDPVVYILISDCVFMVSPSFYNTDDNMIAMNSLQRQMLNIRIGESVQGKVFLPGIELAITEMKVDISTIIPKPDSITITIDCAKLEENFKKMFMYQVFSNGQIFSIDSDTSTSTGIKLKGVVKMLDHGTGSKDSVFGQVLYATRIIFTTSNKDIILVNKILKSNITDSTEPTNLC